MKKTIYGLDYACPHCGQIAERELEVFSETIFHCEKCNNHYRAYLRLQHFALPLMGG